MKKKLFALSILANIVAIIVFHKNIQINAFICGKNCEYHVENFFLDFYVSFLHNLSYNICDFESYSRGEW